MDFKEIIKSEWEKEFPNIEYSYEESLTFALDSLLTNICVRVWNSALELAADNADADFYRPDGQTIECYVLKESILQFKL